MPEFAGDGFPGGDGGENAAEQEQCRKAAEDAGNPWQAERAAGGKHPVEGGGRRTEVRGQMAEDRGRRAEDGGQEAGVGSRESEVRRRRAGRGDDEGWVGVHPHLR